MHEPDGPTTASKPSKATITRLAISRASALSPLFSAGWPQQVCAAGTSTVQPASSSSLTAAKATLGRIRSARQVTKSPTRLASPLLKVAPSTLRADAGSAGPVPATLLWQAAPQLDADQTDPRCESSSGRRVRQCQESSCATGSYPGPQPSGAHNACEALSPSMDQSVYKPLHAPHCTAVCSTCNLREICLPVGLSKDELEYIDARLVTARRKVARGETLVPGRRSLRCGVCRLDRFLQDRHRVEGRARTGHRLPDGRRVDRPGRHRQPRHEVDAVALEDSQVCVIRYHELEALSREISRCSSSSTAS